MLDFKEATRIVLARWEHALGVNFSVSYPVLMSLGKANALISASVGFSDGSAAAFGGTLRIFERHKANAELLNWARTEQLFDDYDEPTNPLWVESLGVAATVREDGSIDLAARGKAANVRPHAGDVQAFLLSLSGEDKEPGEALELLRQCRAFVCRATKGGKKPHAQDKIDAVVLLPKIEAALAARSKPDPRSHVLD